MDADFTALYQKYKNPIFSYVYYLCGDWNVAEEICQEVFLKVYLNISKFEGRSSFKTWIYHIARNTYLDFAQANSKKAHLGKTEQLDSGIVDCGISPEEQALNSELKEYIRKTLCLMEDKYRVLLILRDIQHLSYKEISEVTGQDLNSVKVGIYRARKEFRKIYASIGGKAIDL